MADHLGTYSALVSAAELALSAWLRQKQDAETVVHATNVLAFVLETIDTERLPDDVRRFRRTPAGPDTSSSTQANRAMSGGS